MKKTIVFLAMSSCFILGTSMAHADSDSSQGKMDDKVFKMDEKMFKAMDKDSNGKVTKYEFKDYTKKKYDEMDFHTLDVDGDDNITPTEMNIVSQRNESERKSGGSSGEAEKMDNTRGQKSDNTRSGGTSQSGHH
ncbi:MAG: hypothetical protein Q8L37_00375 [Candidatus Gottesmanbacteria bacterium]|nr:hypothetical protein [Candidatus Gottesmanbacteria bacterium]